MSDKTTRTRVGVTLTKLYLDALDYLVGEGIYTSRGDAIMEALRLLFGTHGIAPFYPKGAEFESEGFDREAAP